MSETYKVLIVYFVFAILSLIFSYALIKFVMPIVEQLVDRILSLTKPKTEVVKQ